ncbi:uroporphyrinogen-III C-methyltransferase [Candidatus Symbiopectobacterium sp. 'North America']|uniref:uroporphyrinogen-III C-methyltransferase n=1 Tax=Candidatus Symbiopectobacterium sp. 'North America' TaxID=2794574 RepID=UPI0018C9C88B|nr:uroporphyrinogen-III C-methyltransferase [Candidatus Symbiopectobacterium sp. 'North America']MBG6246138.1 uroporphyrinogen-III C-methyltransferase [Candidatus Symbiopectobacterium sp. 'North America']
MTEHHTPSTPPETVTKRPDATFSSSDAASADEPRRDRAGHGRVLGGVAIAIALLLSGGVYYIGQQQEKQNAASMAQMKGELAALQQQYQQDKTAWQAALAQQKQWQDSTANQLNGVTRESSELSQKLAALSNHDTSTWLLAQADFLVKLAGRKLWSDKDVLTAGALLKSADGSLADMNDPSLLELRRAIANDISALASVGQVDFDGIILRVNQLTDQVDNLRLADNTQDDDAPMDETDGELSATLSEWRQNLSKSWHNFMSDFITIRRRDSNAEPLLAPNQDFYLRENIRARLLTAAQAVPRHQNETFKQSLEAVSTWVRAYFDTSDPGTKAFLEQVDSLSQQLVSLDVPTTLQSQPLLEKLMQTRVRNLLAQSPAQQHEG